MNERLTTLKGRSWPGYRSTELDFSLGDIVRLPPEHGGDVVEIMKFVINPHEAPLCLVRLLNGPSFLRWQQVYAEQLRPISPLKVLGEQAE